MQNSTKRMISVPVMLLIVGATGVAGAGALTYMHYAMSASMPYAQFCSTNQKITVNVTDFEVQFVYTGSSKDYLNLVAQTPNSHFQSSAQTCPLYFLDAVIVDGIGGSSHTISNLSVSPSTFVFANNGGFSGPQTANEFFPTFTLAYVGDSSYRGPLAIQIYSSS